jgi:HAD superfamily hydrolase (TIGR01509 family)
LIESLHKRKTEIFIDLIRSGRLPLRPGVRRLMTEAREAGLRLGICTTANERSVNAILNAMLPDFSFDPVIARDAIRRKKPDPEIYHLALSRTGLTPDECMVIEDSANGVRAGKAAGMLVVATTNGYTEREDLGAADIVLTSLGDPGGEQGVLQRADRPLRFDGCLHIDALLDYVGASA